MADLCAEVILGINTPLAECDTSNIADVSAIVPVVFKATDCALLLVITVAKKTDRMTFVKRFINNLFWIVEPEISFQKKICLQKLLAI